MAPENFFQMVLSMGKSVYGTINLRDILHGTILAGGIAGWQILKPIILAFIGDGTVPSLASIEAAITTAFLAACMYLGNNFFTNSKGTYGPGGETAPKQ